MPMNDLRNRSAMRISVTSCNGSACYAEDQYFGDTRWYLLLAQKPGYAYHDTLGVRLCI